MPLSGYRFRLLSGDAKPMHQSDISNRVLNASADANVVAPIKPDSALYAYIAMCGLVDPSAYALWPDTGVWPISAAWDQPIPVEVSGDSAIEIYRGSSYHNRVCVHNEFKSFNTNSYEQMQLHMQNAYTLSYSADVSPGATSANIVLFCPYISVPVPTTYSAMYLMKFKIYCDGAARVSLQEAPGLNFGAPWAGATNISGEIHSNSREGSWLWSSWPPVEPSASYLRAYAGVTISSAGNVLEQGIIPSGGGSIILGPSTDPNWEWVLTYHPTQNNAFYLVNAYTPLKATTVVFTMQWIEIRGMDQTMNANYYC